MTQHTSILNSNQNTYLLLPVLYSHPKLGFTVTVWHNFIVLNPNVTTDITEPNLVLQGCSVPGKPRVPWKIMKYPLSGIDCVEWNARLTHGIELCLEIKRFSKVFLFPIFILFSGSALQLFFNQTFSHYNILDYFHTDLFFHSV